MTWWSLKSFMRKSPSVSSLALIWICPTNECQSSERCQIRIFRIPNKALCLFQGLNLSKTSGCFYKSLFNSMLLWRFQFEGLLVTQDCKDYKDQFVH